ncbi:hypothetical protein DFH11DRAFT_1880634 [Phellopilus nigrolimitatus]|nr:hypothetical protein DFH11DRAFT_1880634 [Phellopilus nigrolimitatus]
MTKTKRIAVLGLCRTAINSRYNAAPPLSRAQHGGVAQRIAQRPSAPSAPTASSTAMRHAYAPTSSTTRAVLQQLAHRLNDTVTMPPHANTDHLHVYINMLTALSMNHEAAALLDSEGKRDRESGATFVPPADADKRRDHDVLLAHLELEKRARAKMGSDLALDGLLSLIKLKRRLGLVSILREIELSDDVEVNDFARLILARFRAQCEHFHVTAEVINED